MFFYAFVILFLPLVNGLGVDNNGQSHSSIPLVAGVGVAVATAATLLKKNNDDEVADCFKLGSKCQFLPNIRKNAKDYLWHNCHLYFDTNMKSKAGIKYYRCSENKKGCYAIAHTQVLENGDEVYHSICPNGVPHTCEKSQVNVHVIQFAQEVFNQCGSQLEQAHPKLHNRLYTQFREALHTPEQKDKFDDLVADR